MAQFPTQAGPNSDVWNQQDVYRAVAGSNWPARPGAPTSVTATAGNAQASVAFTAPASNGGSTITSYTVTSSPGGITASGASSPITVTGLTNGTAYTFTVAATNTQGTGASSAASNSVTPTNSRTVVVQVWGGSGGPGRGGNSSGGGYSTSTFQAPPGTVLTYVVGSGYSSYTSGTGIYGGGAGNGTTAAGGFSGVFLGPSSLSQNTATQNRAIVIAGGSGGGGDD